MGICPVSHNLFHPFGLLPCLPNHLHREEEDEKKVDKENYQNKKEKKKRKKPSLAKVPLISVGVDFILCFRYSLKSPLGLHTDLTGLGGVVKLIVHELIVKIAAPRIFLNAALLIPTKQLLWSQTCERLHPRLALGVCV